MKPMMKVAIGMVMVVIAFILFPIVLSSLDDLIQDRQTDSYAAAVTGDNTTYIALLTQALHDDALAEVQSISSNATETPYASSYDSYYLTVANLSANETRALTIIYDYGALDSYTGMETLALVAPVVTFSAMLFSGGFLAWAGFKASR